MTESDASIKIVKLEKLQEKALKYIHNGKNLGVDVDDLCGMYHVQPFKGTLERTYMLCYIQTE